MTSCKTELKPTLEQIQIINKARASGFVCNLMSSYLLKKGNDQWYYKEKY
jgi:hypothetical protein